MARPKKEVIILFGEMGGGKNYHGERIALELGYDFFDGDTIVTPEMKEKVEKFKPINRNIIENYIKVLEKETLIRAKNSAKGLVLAQALYSEYDRQILKRYLVYWGDCKVTFYWVKTPFIRNMRQIFSRPNGFRWVLYWLLSKPFFQKPVENYITI